MSEPYDAFWLRPDWSGGDNLRDPGTVPFWMLPPARVVIDQPTGAVHVCGPIITTAFNYRFCKECERPVDE